MADKEISELTAATTPLAGTELIHVDQGGNSRKVEVSEIAALVNGAMLKSTYDANDDGIISVANGGTNASTASGARTNLGLGTMAVQNAASVAITGGSVTGITDLAIADGGTGASDAATARANLDLEPGVDVQAYLGAGTDGQILKWSGSSPTWGTVAGTGDMVGSNNLSELTNTTTALTNLGGGTFGRARFLDATQNAAWDALEVNEKSPERFGCTSPGVAATNQTGFAALELAFPGREIDLRGRPYNVTTIPDGARYRNGKFLLASGVSRQMPLNVPDSPWHGYPQRYDSRICPSQLMVGMASRDTWDGTTGEHQLFLFEVGNDRHGAAQTSNPDDQPGKAVLLACVSENEGLETLSYRTIVSDGAKSVSGGVRIGNMAGTRIGGLVPIYDPVTDTYAMNVWTNDDWLATDGTLNDVSASLTGNHFLYQPGIPWPASDGGDDVNGFMWLTYKAGADADIWAVTTTDNGATVSEMLIKTGVGVIPAPAVAREGQLIRTPSGVFLFCRPGVFLTPSWVNVALADDLAGLAAAPWVSTGIRLDNNPCTAFYDRGNVVLCIVDRELASHDRQENIMRVYIQDHKSLWEAGGVFDAAAEHIMPMSNRGTGEPQVYPLPQGDYIASIRTGEAQLSQDLPGGGHTILMRSMVTPFLANPETVSVAEPQEFLFNGNFNDWSGATSFPAVASLTHVADNWQVLSTGDTVNVSRVALPEKVRAVTIHRPDYGMRLEVTASNGSTGWRSILTGQDARRLLKSLTDRPHVSVGLFGYGDFPPDLVCNVLFQFGAGGSPDIAVANQTFPKAHSQNDGVWYSEVHFTIGEQLTDAEVIGVNPNVILTFQNTTAALYDTTLIGVSGVIGKHPIWKPFVPQPTDFRRREGFAFLSNGDVNHNFFIDNFINYVSGPTAAFGITGFSAPLHINEFFLYNDTAFDMKLLNLNAGSITENGIITGTGADDSTTGAGVYHLIRSRKRGKWVVAGKVG